MLGTCPEIRNNRTINTALITLNPIKVIFLPNFSVKNGIGTFPIICPKLMIEKIGAINS